MRKELLNLVSTEYLCPKCGEWHEWFDTSKRLGSESHNLYCTVSDMIIGTIYFEGDYFHYLAEMSCTQGYNTIEGNIPISDFVEDKEEAFVTSEIIVVIENHENDEVCTSCMEDDGGMCVCQCSDVKVIGNKRHIPVKFGFGFNQTDYDKIEKKI